MLTTSTLPDTFDVASCLCAHGEFATPGQGANLSHEAQTVYSPLVQSLLQRPRRSLEKLCAHERRQQLCGIRDCSPLPTYRIAQPQTLPVTPDLGCDFSVHENLANTRLREVCVFDVQFCAADVNFQAGQCRH